MIMSKNYIHADDNTILVTQDNETWVEVTGPPGPSTSMPMPKKRKSLLTLPFSIPIGLCSTSCVDGLAAKEVILWVKDCSDSPHNIWCSLHEVSLLSSYRSKKLIGNMHRLMHSACLKPCMISVTAMSPGIAVRMWPGFLLILSKYLKVASEKVFYML